MKNMKSKVVTIICVILCIVFSLTLIGNTIVIIKGITNPEEPPAVLNVMPMIVLSNSMSGEAPDHIEVGDMIFVTKAKPEELEVGDIISFMKDSVVITHRIIDIEVTENQGLLFYTKGDANKVADKYPVTESELVGIYRGRIPKIGELSMFMQTPLGMVLFVGLPFTGFLIYDTIRRRRYDATESGKTEELMAEVERLRALVKEKE